MADEFEIRELVVSENRWLYEGVDAKFGPCPLAGLKKGANNRNTPENRNFGD